MSSGFSAEGGGGGGGGLISAFTYSTSTARGRLEGGGGGREHLDWNQWRRSCGTSQSGYLFPWSSEPVWPNGKALGW